MSTFVYHFKIAMFFHALNVPGKLSFNNPTNILLSSFSTREFRLFSRQNFISKIKNYEQQKGLFLSSTF